MLSYKAKKRMEFIANMSNPKFEPFYSEYLNDLQKLNQIVLEQQEVLEGNIFYRHGEKKISANNFDSEYLPKRRTYALVAQMFSDVLEIGFNAGHSALLLLTANPQMKLVCIDICAHRYTIPCFDYLKQKFGERIELIDASSLYAFSLLARQNRNFGLYIIDGGHDEQIAETDLYNVIQYGHKGSVICFDDSNVPSLRLILNMHMLTGRIINISDRHGFLKNEHQMFFINNKSE